MTKHDAFCLFCKMVINKTIVRVISLSNRSCPYEFNASIDFWLKTTSHANVIAPSTVSTTQNAKLLPSPNLGHSLMLCQVTRSQDMGECETLRRPPVLVEPSTGCPVVREKSGKFQTWQKSGKSQGILLKVKEKNEYWEKSGNLHLVQSK